MGSNSIAPPKPFGFGSNTQSQQQQQHQQQLPQQSPNTFQSTPSFSATPFSFNANSTTTPTPAFGSPAQTLNTSSPPAFGSNAFSTPSIPTLAVKNDAPAQFGQGSLFQFGSSDNNANANSPFAAPKEASGFSFTPSTPTFNFTQQAPQQVIRRYTYLNCLSIS